MILTTHSMEEADVLTTRVAIMSQGRYEDRFSLCVGVVMWCGVCCEVVWGVCGVWCGVCCGMMGEMLCGVGIEVVVC